MGSTGNRSPDGRNETSSIEVFTHDIPEWMTKELKQAEDDLINSEHPNNFIPWAVFGPKGGNDDDMIIFTRLRYFPTVQKQEAAYT